MLADGRVIDTSQPTGTNPFIIVYTVTNSAGLTTTVRRTVEVADPCAAPLTYCTSTGMAYSAPSLLTLLITFYDSCVCEWNAAA